MRHKEIWTEIAKAFHSTRKTKAQKSITGYGLCCARDRLGGASFHHLAHLLNCPIREFSTNISFWLPIRSDDCHQNKIPHTRKHDLIRGDFAALMACMTEEEFYQLNQRRV